jgi:SAM-dependent methyltransferase
MPQTPFTAPPCRPAWPRASQAGLLHHGGSTATWASLGLWVGAADYAAAARALAQATGRAAGLASGHRVLSLACGAGDELLLWLEAFGAAEVVGVEQDAAAADAARRLLARAGRSGDAAVLTADAMALDIAALGTFDPVLCVDAAYHLSPRAMFLQRAAGLLRPGGRLAFGDLVGPAEAGRRPLLGASARLCGLSFDELLPEAAMRRRLTDAGLGHIQLERLDDAVLGGFARFVAAQRRRLGAAAWQPAWLRPALTAALIPPCRRLGLGYALLSARRPP